MGAIHGKILILSILLSASLACSATATQVSDPKNSNDSVGSTAESNLVGQDNTIPANLSAGSANKVLPNDVLQTVSYSAIGGGSGNHIACPQPGLYYDDDLPNSIILKGFYPNEDVRLIIYSESGIAVDFVAWQGFQVDNTGSLIIDISDDRLRSYQYVVIGKSSGDIYPRKIFDDGNCQDDTGGFDQRILKDATSFNSNSAIACPDAPARRLSVGDKARVTFSNGLSVRLRQQPRKSGEYIRSIPEGTLMDVIDGPECADSFLWWKIRLTDGTEGWVAEGESDNYFLEPGD